MFRREVTPSTRDNDVLVDSALADASYVDSFGFEWTQIDGMAGKEAMTHGHVFGRFVLPRDFFAGKQVVDVGCGNGRVGRLIAPLCDSYIGLDLSEAVFAFPRYIARPPSFKLIQASGTDLPLADAVADVAVCWGVLHHMDRPDAALSELFRVTKPGGIILVYVYPQQFDVRKNLNHYMRGLPLQRAHQILDTLSDGLDTWREVDGFYAGVLANLVALGFKHTKDWQKFQWFDGITPRYHWSLETRIAALVPQLGGRATVHRPGCFYIQR